MTLYIPSKDDLEKIVETTVSKAVKEVLPEAIRKATRKRWLTTDEVMEILQVSRRQVQTYRDENKLAFTQHGRTIRYDINDVEDFLLNHKVKRIDR